MDKKLRYKKRRKAVLKLKRERKVFKAFSRLGVSAEQAEQALKEFAQILNSLKEFAQIFN